MPSPPATDRLRPWEKAGLAGFALLFLAFGVVTEIRSAFQTTRKTDAGVYFRAAWAVRAGQDPFEVIDDNNWHYCYPPALAVALAPLADPPPGEPRAGYLPYWASVAAWYLLGLGFACLASHLLAGAILPDAVPGSRRWWYARSVPLYVCLGGIGFTLGRGQVNTLIVALLAASFAALAAGRRVRSGAWLAGAIVVKVIPAYLLLFPFVRRDGRAFAGVAAGLFVLLGVVPAAVWGVGGAVEMNRKVVELVLMPGATGGGDQTRAKELTGAAATDSQSFQAAIHAFQYPDPETRPNEASRWVRLTHLAIGGLLTLAAAWVGWRRLGPAPADQLVYLGCLCVLMLLLSPVSHMHYYAFAFPLAAGLWLRSMADRPGALGADRRTTLVLAAWGIAAAIPLFPGPLFDLLRERGFAPAATLGLWAFALREITRKPAASAATTPEPLRHAA